MATITKDFFVKAGLTVQGTNSVTSSTGSTSSLQVNGGAAIAKNLIVGTSAVISDALTVYGASSVAGLTASGVVNITNGTTATTGGAGALTVSGGTYIGGRLIVNDPSSSSVTTNTNSIVTQGGLGVAKDLIVGGNAVLSGNLTVLGTQTIINSTSTAIQDPVIDIGTGPSNAPLTLDDGLNKGLVIHYYDTADDHMFIGRINSTGRLAIKQNFDSGSSNIPNSDYATSGTYSAVDLGELKVHLGTANSSNTNSGALQVVGGVGIGGSLYAGSNISGATVTARNLTANRVVLAGVGGILTDDAELTYNTVTNLLSAQVAFANTATNIAGGASGGLPYQNAPGDTVFLPIGTAGFVLQSSGSAPQWTPLSGVTAGEATTASNLKFGFANAIPYQTAAGATSFEQQFQYDFAADTFRTVNAVFTGTTGATNTSSGAVQVRGGVGIAENLFVGGLGSVGGALTVGSNALVAGGTLNTVATTFNLVNTTATTVNFAGAATVLTVGATSGYTEIRNATTVTNTTGATSTSTGALQVRGGVGIAENLFVGNNVTINGTTLTASGSTFNLINANAATVNFAGAATALTVGATTGYTEIRNATTITNTTAAASTSTGALQVRGGVGIAGNIFVGGSANITGDTTLTGDLAITGGDLVTVATTFNLLNTTATTVNFAGAASAITVGATTGFTAIRNLTTVTNTTAATSTNTGALRVEGGVGIGGNIFVGGTSNILGNENIAGDLTVNGGDIFTVATTFNLVNTTATTVNFAGAATALTIGATTGFTAIRNATTITNTTAATSTATGALRVEGGVGIGGNIFVGGSANVTGRTTVNDLVSGNTTATSLTVTNNASVGGILSVSNSSNATASNNGALRVTGGVGIVQDLVVGGAITAGTTAAATTGTVVPALFSNNVLWSSYTSTALAGTAQANLDTFASATYRSIKYFIQIVDGSNVHITEIVLFHDGTDVFLHEYGIMTNGGGQRGTFDATLASGTVTLKFTPSPAATAMTIKVVRMAVTV
jgi:hypothetical protein